MNVRELKKKLAPLGFSSLEVFQTWRLKPGKALSLFLQDSKQKLQHAMPDISCAARNQLLLHQFLVGLSVQICKQLQAARDVTTMETTFKLAWLLMSVEAEQKLKLCTASITSVPQNNKCSNLKNRLTNLLHK